ncbi:carph-isopro domain-containing protein [Chromobacterium phragmitis]|uniref:carph-isopro domain-containing protein n=1 Tax=Chromobacterium phragmitis TaxID=2202141 RepID=UPI00399F6374
MRGVRNMANVSPPKLVVERFGGPQAVATALEAVTGRPVNRSTVATWVRRDRLPGRVLADLLRAASHAGVVLTHKELIDGGQS